MTLRSSDHIGLALLGRALARPSKSRLLNNPMHLLTPEFDHDHSDSQPAPSDAQPARSPGRVLRRSVELS